jgi:hypothetical protein
MNALYVGLAITAPDVSLVTEAKFRDLRLQTLGD